MEISHCVHLEFCKIAYAVLQHSITKMCNTKLRQHVHKEIHGFPFSIFVIAKLLYKKFWNKYDYITVSNNRLNDFKFSTTTIKYWHYGKPNLHTIKYLQRFSNTYRPLQFMLKLKISRNYLLLSLIELSTSPKKLYTSISEVNTWI